MSCCFEILEKEEKRERKSEFFVFLRNLSLSTSKEEAKGKKERKLLIPLTVLRVHRVLDRHDVQRKRRTVDRQQQRLGARVDADSSGRGRGHIGGRLVSADVGELPASFASGAACFSGNKKKRRERESGREEASE